MHTPLDDGEDVSFPHRQGVAYRPFKGGEVIGAGDAMAKSGDVIERGLDHVRSDA